MSINCNGTTTIEIIIEDTHYFFNIVVGLYYIYICFLAVCPNNIGNEAVPETTILADTWRAYINFANHGYVHEDVNHIQIPGLQKCAGTRIKTGTGIKGVSADIFWKF